MNRPQAMIQCVCVLLHLAAVACAEAQDSEIPGTPSQDDTQREQIEAGRNVLASLPKDRERRILSIIDELRKLDHTVDECEVWCALIRELATIGRRAVPALCRELETTDSQQMLRRLCFALRAIGDLNAVPSLVRAIPKTLRPSLNDYELIVADPELASFMRIHQIARVPNGGSGLYFCFGRPIRELTAALQRITNHSFEGTNLSNLMLREDQRAAAAQSEIYHLRAAKWAQWWNANSASFDVADHNKNIALPEHTPVDLSDCSAGLVLTDDARVEGVSCMVICPVGDPDRDADFFLDLDLGSRPRWPKFLHRDDSSPETIAAARQWAMKRGLDLMCVMTPGNDGQPGYSLSGIDLQLWEIKRSDRKNLVKLVGQGKLPAGRRLDTNRLLHLDANGELQSEIDSSFLYVTREQGIGVIMITDFITEARDITGMINVPQGVGFYRGVEVETTDIAR